MLNPQEIVNIRVINRLCDLPKMPIDELIPICEKIEEEEIERIKRELEER